MQLQELEGKAREARQEREARQAKLEAVLATVQAGSLWVSARGVSASSSTRRSSEGGLHTWWMKNLANVDLLRRFNLLITA